jgi:hypothetical protein
MSNKTKRFLTDIFVYISLALIISALPCAHTIMWILGALTLATFSGFIANSIFPIQED